jgi:hypothetical protein
VIAVRVVYVADVVVVSMILMCHVNVHVDVAIITTTAI